MQIINSSLWAKLWWLLLYTGALIASLSAGILVMLLCLCALGYWHYYSLPKAIVALRYESDSVWMLQCRDGSEYYARIAPGTVIWNSMLLLVFHIQQNEKIKTRRLCLWPDSMDYQQRRTLASRIALYVSY